jgi:hypothetical protein
MGTSQSAIARIEGAEENITIGTLQRLLGALKGRLQVSIAPEEMHIARPRPWWEMYDVSVSNRGWNLVAGAFRQIGTTEQVVLGFQKGQAKSLMLTETTS